MSKVRSRWTQEQAWRWYRQRPVPYGFNFLPSTAVNTTEMWQTFDEETIKRELGWAAEIGFNSCRVFLQYLVWQENSQQFKERFAQFLAIAAEKNLSVLPVLFDDCAFAGKEPYLGPQDAPSPGIHNSGWTPSPGPTIADNYANWVSLEMYIKDMLGSFAMDPGVLAWDLYNEPGNNHRGVVSLPLLAQAFIWAREVDPAQPLTAGAWLRFAENDQLCLALSDIMTFHHYGKADILQSHIDRVKQSGYPVVCTEWMARTLDSLIATHLPIFAREEIGCYMWGLVRGKTQTYLPWGSTAETIEPALWFHDVFYTDGTPYNKEEITIMQRFSRTITTKGE